jgi:hypothetical protein
MEMNIQEVAEQRLADVLSSTSWRITAPIRFIGNQVRRLLGKT